MNNKYFIGIVALASVAAVISAASFVSAYQGNSEVKGPNYTAERHEAMTNAFDSGDYQAWKELMGNRGPARFITEENFAKFSEMHKLMLDGKYEEAARIRAELGMGNGQGQGQGRGGRGAGCPMAGLNR